MLLLEHHRYLVRKGIGIYRYLYNIYLDHAVSLYFRLKALYTVGTTERKMMVTWKLFMLLGRKLK